jgi:membrane-associated phospholipid phosphatase
MRLLLLVVLAASFGTVRTAHAGDRGQFDWKAPRASYWWDGGAIPFLYLPLAMNLGYRAFREPPAEPVMFSKMEGGRSYDGGQFPVTMLWVDAIAAGGAIVLGGDDSRWHHAKGFAQGLAMTSMLTALAKSTFGRHRPMYDLGDGAVNPKDSSKSFWSGHSSMTLATATYLGLYARQHLFDRWRPEGTLPWWEVASYAALAVGAAAIPYSQYHLNRHHASDVITGSLVGATVAGLAYWFQERNYRRDKAHPSEVGKPEPMTLSILPDSSMRGLSLSGTW